MTSSIGATSSSAASSTSTLSPDVAARVQQVLASQATSITKLNNTLTTDQTTLSGLGQLQSALASFETTAQGMSSLSQGTGATSTNTGVAGAQIGTGATPGSYALTVQQLAQGQYLTSSEFPSSSTPIGAGATSTVTVDFGTADGGSFTANGSSQSITINSSNDTLDGIAAAFQAAGINAKVVQGSDGQYALAIQGQTGANNSMKISVSGDPAVQNLLAYDPAGTQAMTQTSPALDAQLIVDGKAVTSASNSVTSAVAGTTLTLSATGKSTITVSQDASQIAAGVASFVTAYNTLNSKLQSLQSAGMAGDPAFKQASNQLSLLVKTGGTGVSILSLQNAGITVDGSGNLQLDTGKLNSAIAANPGAVSQLFTNNGSGLADQLATTIGNLTGSNSSINHESTQLNSAITTINTKRTAISNALTAQGNALAALYTAQAQDAAGSALLGSSSGSSSSSSSAPSSLFDLLGDGSDSSSSSATSTSAAAAAALANAPTSLFDML